GRALDQVIGKRLGRLAGEESAVGIGQPSYLRLDRLDHAWMAVAETGDRGAAAGIQIAIAVAIDDLDPFAAHGDRVALLGLAIEDVAHQGLFTSDWHLGPR